MLKWFYFFLLLKIVFYRKGLRGYEILVEGKVKIEAKEETI